MQNKERFESLRLLAPIQAVQAWLEGGFGIGHEPALTEAIRKDTQVSLSDDQIAEAICDAMVEGLNAQECLESLRGSVGNQS